MKRFRVAFAICALQIGCNAGQPQSGAFREQQTGNQAGLQGEAQAGVNKTNGDDESRTIIRTGDSLAGTIAKLRQYQISVSDATPAIDWKDGKDRRLYQLSMSRTPQDALVLVALHNSDGTDSQIEGMFWDVDFIKQHVPKVGRPDPIHEPVESVAISELVSPLASP